MTRVHKDLLLKEHDRSLLKLSKELTQENSDNNALPKQLLVDAKDYLRIGRPEGISDRSEEMLSIVINIAWR